MGVQSVETKVRPEVRELTPNRTTCGEFTQIYFNICALHFC
jgi:hypothetical protein